MTPTRYARLPLRALAVFEAAARHGKFASAAQELAMTQAGVSQHIAQLEAELGIALFHRQHRGVALTVAGANFAQGIGQGLAVLAEAVAGARADGVARPLHIRTDFGFAAWWLMPRIGALAQLMPQVDVRLITAQNGIAPGEEDCDLAILFGDGQWPGCVSRLLFGEEVWPVCSPAYLATRGLAQPVAPAQIAQQRLLHLRAPGHAPARRRWFEWDDWFAAMGLPAPDNSHALEFSNYQLVLQATLLGQGVGLGWAPLIDDLVASGGLIRLSEAPLLSPRGYHIVEPQRAGANPVASRVAEWLLGGGA